MLMQPEQLLVGSDLAAVREKFSVLIIELLDLSSKFFKLVSLRLEEKQIVG